MSEESKQLNPAAVEASSAASPVPTSTAAAAAEFETARPSSEKSNAAQTQTAKAAATPSGDKPGAAAPLAADVAKPPTAAATPAGKAAVAAPAAKPAVPKPAPPKPAAPKPEPWDSPVVRSLKSQYGSGIREASIYAGQKYLVVDSSLIYEILRRMRDDEAFNYCVDVTAIHYPKREAQFDVLYILYSFHNNERVRIKAQIKDGERLRSACGLWPTANWLEREVFDMFGIEFDGHPELKRILMPDDWKGHPLRKDYGILQQDADWVKQNIGIESAQ
jgi:NADH-quinone oxidoreductase subunit C